MENDRYRKREIEIEGERQRQRPNQAHTERLKVKDHIFSDSEDVIEK